MLVKMICLSFSILTISLNSFALNSKEANELSEKSKLDTVYSRINSQASIGYCNLDAYKEFISKAVKQQLIVDGYKLNDIDKVHMGISWCE